MMRSRQSTCAGSPRITRNTLRAYFCLWFGFALLIAPKAKLPRRARHAVWCFMLCLLGLLATPAAHAQTAPCASFYPGAANIGYLPANDVCTVLLQGTMKAVYSSQGNSEGGQPTGCTVQMNVQILSVTSGSGDPADPSLSVSSFPSTWSAVVQGDIANGNDNYALPMAGSATISNCAAPVGVNNPSTAATVVFNDSADWSAYFYSYGYGCNASSEWTFYTTWIGTGSDGNPWLDTWRFDTCPNVSGGALTVTPAGVSGTISGSDQNDNPFSATVCLAPPGATASCPATTPANSPTITSLAPSSATAGSSTFTLTVNGSNFASGATVQWNGTNLPTTFVSSTQLTTSVSASLIASAGTASVTVSSGGQTSPSVSFTISSASGGGSSVSVVTKYTSTTDGIVNGSCVPPAATSSFTTASSQVWLYFGITGVAASDTAQINWVEPSGTVYETENTTAGFAGTGCFAFHINVSGAAAASYPGTWTIQVLWDNSSLFSLNFTIASSSPVPTLITDVISNTNGIVNNVCTTPASVTSFTTASSQVWITFSVTGAAVGNSATINFLRPGGVLYQSYNSAITSVGSGGYQCFSYGINISGASAASYPGNWTIQVLWNQSSTPLVSLNFTIGNATPTGPVITAVLNAASYAAGGVAPGEIVYISGSGMGPAQVVGFTLNSADSVPTSLQGTGVTFNGTPAPLIYTSATAVAAVVPYEISGTSNTQVIVSYQGQASAAFTVSTVSSLPGFFTANSSGSGSLAATHANGALITANNPASPGEVVVLYATGGGQTSPAGLDGKLTSGLTYQVSPVTLTIGGVNASPAYAGGAPGEVAGVMQINAQIPQGVGGAVPVVVTVGTAQSQPGATIAVTGTSGTESPATLELVSGNNQAAPANQAFPAPLVVQVTDSLGNSVSGAALTWTVSQGAATLSSSLSSTNAAGQGSTTVLAGSSAGVVIIAAQVGSLTARFTLTVTASGVTSVTSLYSSGQNTTNGRDNSYQILTDTTGEITAPAAALVVNSPGWSAVVPGAAWIAPSADESADRLGCCANTADTYSTTFSVSGNPSAVTLNVTLAADDYVDVELNGNFVFTHPSTVMWNAPVSFLISSGFVSGTNTLEFLVSNSGGGPTGLVVAITAAVSGLTQVTPGQTLTISGNFKTATSVTTTVAFSDNAGYQVSVLPLSVTNGSVSVSVPPYVNLQQGNITSGSLTASVVQQPTSGQSTTTAPLGVEIGALPPTGVSPGLITLDVLTQLSQLAGTANQAWSTIASDSSGTVNTAQLNLAALQSSLSSAQAQVQSLVSGTVTQLSIGQAGGKSVYLDINGLALMDQVFYAYYLGSTLSPANLQTASLRQLKASTASRRLIKVHPNQVIDDPLTDFHDWFAGTITATLPQYIANNAGRLRGAASAAIGIAVLLAAPAEVAVASAAAVGGFVWLAATWASAATTTVLEGAGGEILDTQPPDTQDLPVTMGIISDGYIEMLTSSADDNIAEQLGAPASTLNTIWETIGGIEQAVDPNNPSSVTSQVLSAIISGLFNQGSPFNGTWSGTFTRTPSTCPSYSGALQNATITVSDGTVSGSVVIADVPIYDSNCNVIEVENDGSVGSIDGMTTGTDSNGHATISGSMYDVYNDLDWTGTWQFTATLVNGVINGVFANGGGTFTLHN